MWEAEKAPIMESNAPGEAGVKSEEKGDREMKRTVTLALALSLALTLLGGCANSDTPAQSAESKENFIG